jgi:histidine decarboxylase
MIQRLSCFLIINILLATGASALTREKQRRIDQFAENALAKSSRVSGYPINQDTELDDFYRWYTRKKLFRASMNNVGNPLKSSPYTLNTHQFENEVISYFADLYGFKRGDFWGFVTSSGTDGNQHGVYFGRKSLLSKSSIPPILYVSREAHYSIPKLADVQGIELRLIATTEMGQMDLEDFKRQLEPARPALIVVAMGTTFKGAIDDQDGIRRILEEKHKAPSYIHLDAALFGGFLAYADTPVAQLLKQKEQRFDSIAVSGHKFFGFDEPMGIFISTKQAFDNLNPLHVNYLNDAVPTITCSRSALGPLKFWWKINSTPISKFKAISKAMLSDSGYLERKLRSVGIRVWRNPDSNTVFFERPKQEILAKYDLASDESPQLGKLAHVLIMPHVHKPLIDTFVADMNRWKHETVDAK